MSRISSVDKWHQMSFLILLKYFELSTCDRYLSNMTNNELNNQLIANQDFNGLLAANIRYIQYVAYTLGINDEDIINDLVQEGRIGLWIAYTKYDPNTQPVFIGYAKFYIKKYMLRYLEVNLRTIKLPPKLLAQIKLGTFTSTTNTISLSTPVGENGTILEDLIPSEVCEDQNDNKPLRKALECFSLKDQDIIRMRYGLEPYLQEYTLQEIAWKYECTREAIRLKINKLLNKLSKYETIKPKE